MQRWAVGYRGLINSLLTKGTLINVLKWCHMSQTSSSSLWCHKRLYNFFICRSSLQDLEYFLHCLITTFTEVTKSFMQFDLPGSERWDGWAVSAGRAHTALCSVSPGQTPTSSAWCTPLSDPVQWHTQQWEHVMMMMMIQLVQIQTHDQKCSFMLPFDSAELGPHGWPPVNTREHHILHRNDLAEQNLSP